MQFNKVHHPVNCVFARTHRSGRLAWRGRAGASATVTNLGDDIFRLELAGPPAWRTRLNLSRLTPPADPPASRCRLTLDAEAALRLVGPAGEELLAGRPGRTLGACGDAWLVNLVHDPARRCWGGGEQWGGQLEKSGRRFRCVNTDVWADHPGSAVRAGEADPLYVSIPYVIVRTGGRYVGILVDNGWPAFFSLGGRYGLEPPRADDAPEEPFFFGADGGKPIVYLLVGDTLAALTEKYQRLVGTQPLPPLWALGHHQCRWGYASRADLERLDRGFRRHRIPTDALWLDIDYMDRFQVFTFAKEHWPRPARDLAALHARGRKVVAILDPGVKVRPGYAVYRSGLAGDHFCRTPEGEPFVGFVWPGRTCFPDFSQERTRAWWARWAKGFFATGMDGAWLDMNDVAVGGVENGPCRFRGGTLPHHAFRNEYALGMAMATWDAFRAAHPDRRPFLLSRSGSTGQARFTANWTGDNCANAAHLRGSIPCTLNLALSGMPFNGPDVPGFGGNPDADLAMRWYKAGFLFPFLRNHSNKPDRAKEPWTFGATATRVIGHYIRLRYKLLPYLYNLWIDQEERGSAVLRPLLYEFPDEAYDRVADQFMVGPALLQAPVLEPGSDRRTVLLPPGWWYDAAAGRWIRGGRRLAVRAGATATPLYVREGTIVPMQPGERTDHRSDLADIELHVFVRPGGSAGCRYRWDAGEGYGYRRGERGAVTVQAASRRGRLELALADAELGCGPVRLRVVTYGGERRVAWTRDGQRTEGALTAHRWTFAGARLRAARSAPLTVR